MEGLKNNLKEQDKRIENLKEKVNILEAQNKELKTKVALWSETPRTTVSKSVSTSELKTVDSVTPYVMLIKLRKWADWLKIWMRKIATWVLFIPWNTA